jgi:hypothetical protein
MALDWRTTSRGIVEPVPVHQRFVAAELASHRQRVHAVRAHVGERDRRAAVAVGGHVARFA